MCVYVCEHTQRPEDNLVWSFSCTPPFFLGDSLSLTWNSKVRQTGQPVRLRDYPVSITPSMGFQEYNTVSSFPPPRFFFFLWVLGIAHRQALY